MKWSLGLISLAASLWSSLGWELRCSDKEYPFSRQKCCAKCPAGEELKDRCTDTSPTVCEPCDENYYNDGYTEWRCKPCRECNADEGLREIRACQRTSDTVCACLPGYARETPEDSGRCKPCPSGYFSPEGSEKCHPWTNCTARGWKTLQSGKQDADTICDKRSGRITTRGTATPSTPVPKKTGSSTTTKQDLSPIVPTNPGFVWLLITVVLLLAIAGALTFLIVHCRTKRKKLDILCNEIYAVKEENDCRMPIQEQEAGDKSNFVQG